MGSETSSPDRLDQLFRERTTMEPRTDVWRKWDPNDLKA